MLIIALYLSLGSTLALGLIAVPILRGHIRLVAERLDMSLAYAQTLWIVGTIIAWPVGLYVLATGRLILPIKDHDMVFDPLISVRPRQYQKTASRSERLTARSTCRAGRLERAASRIRKICD